MNAMESVTASLPEDILAQVKALKKNPGEALNTVLDEYVSAGGNMNLAKIANAVADHVKHPSVSEAPVKRTSIYMVPTRMKALRQYTQKSYLPFDGLLRVLVSDYFTNHQS